MRFSFVAFCLWLGVTLTPGQRVLAAVAYDGHEPSAATTPQAKALATKIFGPVATISPRARAVLNATCGARAGKSYVLLALRLLWGALVRDLSPLAPGEAATSVVVAPTLKLARQTLGYIKGALSHPELSPMVLATSAEEIVIRRPDGAHVAFRALAAGRAGAALRGRWYTDAALDEAAFFRDAETGVVNDADLFRAVSPRVLPGGQVIIASTPWAEAGLLYDLHRENYGHPVTALAAHAPTLVLYDTALTREIVERERQRDPDNAAREYDAEFIGGGSLQFFESGAIDAACRAAVEMPRKALPGEYVAVGADFGFRSDSSAIVVVHRSADGQKFALADLEELRPEDGKPLKPSVVVRKFAGLVKQHGASYVMADQHYRETIAEHLGEEELGFLDAPAGSLASDPFVRARVLFREGKVQLPDHQRLRAQLKSVIGKALPGGGLRIVQPRLAKGGHGDLVSALVLALHQAGGVEVPEKEHAPGSPEWSLQQMNDMLRRDSERHDRKQSAEWWEEGIGDDGPL